MKLFILMSFIVVLAGCQNTANPDLSTVQDPNTPFDTATNKIAIQYKQKTVIEKPFSNIDIAFKEFDYKNNRNNIFELASGTVIEIPKNSFKNRDGKAITDKIIIRYRELHSISDIMLSGINMTYDDSDFESAGMFEIRAFSGDEELDLRENKVIGVDMASFKEGDFNSFYMDEEAGGWETLGPNKVKPNSKKKEKLEALAIEEAEMETVCNFEPRAYKNGDQLFDLDYRMTNYNDYDLFQGAMWVISGGKAQENAFKKDRLTYHDIEIIPKDNCESYTLTLWTEPTLRRERIEKKYTVTPVWKGAEYKRAKINFKERIKTFRDKMKEIVRKRKVAHKEADILRSFQIKGMGIFNCDRTVDYLKLITVGIVISSKEKIKSWWYITRDKRIAIKYYSAVDPNFKYNKNSTNSLIAILESGEVATVDEVQFLAAYKAYLSNTDPAKQLELELILEKPIVIETEEDFAACVINN